MADYVYNLASASDMKKLGNFFDRYAKELNSPQFKKFIAEKCIKELEKIMQKNLQSIPEYHVSTEKLIQYKENNKYEIKSKKIIIYNDTMQTVEEMYWLAEKTKDDYAEGISIASIIEYGTGMRGKNGEDWQVNLQSGRKNKDGSWTFKKDDITYKKVKGLEGRFIYQKLLDSIDKYFEIWFEEYLERIE